MVRTLQLRFLVRFLRFYLLFFLLGNGNSDLYGQYFGPTPPPQVSDTLTAIWQDEVNNFGAVGGIIGIYVPGQWYWAGSTGNALITPATTADTSMHFRAGSLSKSFVAASLLKLQEQGTLDLDDLISLWLPTILISGIPNGNQISIRQLLNHSSGVGNYTSSPGFVATLASQGVGHVFTPEELVAFGASQGASFPPGNGFDYSNTNYTLAAMIIEAASNQTYETFIANNLLTPLGLSQSYFPTTDTLPGAFMGSYYDINNSPPRENFSYVNPSGTYGSGALVSKLTDLISWLKAINEGQILNPASQTEMLTFINSNIQNTDYGLGIGLYNNGNFSSLGHTGAVFNSSNMQYNYTSDYYVVYNITDLDFDHFGFLNRLENYLSVYLQACANFQPGNISSPSRIGLNAGETITLIGPTTAGLTYQWFLNGQAISGAQSQTYTANTVGDYTLQIGNSLGCSFLSESVVLQDCSPYQVAIDNQGATADFCLGETVNLSAGDSFDNISWLDRNGIPLQSNSNTYQFMPQVNDFIQMVALDTIGCRAEDTLSYQVFPRPIANLGSDITDCPNTSINLQAGLAGDQVDWYNLNGGLLAGNSPSYNFLLQSSSTVIVSVNNTCGEARDTLNYQVLPRPVADLGSDITDCPNTSINLQAGLAGDQVDWYNQNGGLLVGNSPSYNFSLQSSGQVIVSVNNTCGEARDTLNYQVLPRPVADLGSDITDCPNTSINLQAGLAGDQVDWYNQNGGLLLGNSPTYNFSLQSSGKVIVSVNNTCGEARDTLDIQVNPLPFAALGNDISDCQGINKSLETGEVGDSVVWYDLLGNVLLNNSRTYNFQIQNSGGIIAEVHNTCGQDRDTVMVTAIPSPLADLGPDFSSCIGSNLSFSIGDPGDLVNWFEANGNLLKANDNTYDFVLAADIALVVERISTCGTTRDTVEIEANAVASIDIGPDLRVCKGTNLTVSPGNIPDPVNWFDINGNLLLSNAVNFPIEVLEDLEIVAEIVSSCGTARDTLQITAVDLPVVDLGPDTTIISGNRITLNAGSMNDIVNWYDGRGNLLLGNNTTYFTNPQGPISVVAEVITPDGCTASDTIFVDVTVSIERPEDIGLHVFPNPTSERLFLHWETQLGKIWSWKMLNLRGKEVSFGHSSEKNTHFDVEELPEGIYLLRIMRDNQIAIIRVSIIH